MTEKKLRDDIIVKMLDYRDESNVGIKEFCKTKNIKFSSDEQQERVFHYLKDNGYINAQFYINGDGYFSITSEGIDYAESLIAQSIVETTKPIEENEVEIDANFPGHLPSTNIIQEVTSSIYTTKENSTKIVDNSVEACFNVEKLADCYVKLIDRACENEQNNVCMFGIFAPWGRGKTYFFRKVKECINERTDSKAIQYDIVEFNAWKYQETPAIWAYLFETLYNSKDWWFKFFYTLRRNRKSIASEIILCISPTIITAIASLLINIDYVLWTIASSASSIGLFSNFISKHYNSAISLIKKYSKGISFANELGIQAEIEKEITSLLKFWISEKKTVEKKVILYIDDIDRCSETKMTSIIDSLRTVLENKEIRKRLIIVCSIDPDKIIKGIEYKYKTLYDNDDKKIHTIAIEQMDKIFLTGIALAPLNNEQLFEFSSRLTEVEDKGLSINEQRAKFLDNQREANSTATSKNNINEKKEEQTELDNIQIYKHLKNLINNYKEQLTPRKIRIIYYRILLANNIICNKENPMITETLIKNIFELSVGNKIEQSDKDEELTDILNMVVPYRYNEENEVTSKVTQG